MTVASSVYAAEHPDLGFAIFMDRVDRAVLAKTGMSFLDFADAPWADLYEDYKHGGLTDEVIFETLADADDLFRLGLTAFA